MESNSLYKLGTSVLNGLGSYFQNRDNQAANQTIAASNATAVTETVKFLGVIAVIGFILTAVIKIFKR